MITSRTKSGNGRYRTSSHKVPQRLFNFEAFGEAFIGRLHLKEAGT